LVLVFFPLKEEFFASKAIPDVIHSITTGEQTALPRRTRYRVLRKLMDVEIIDTKHSIRVPIIDGKIVLNTRDSCLSQIMSNKLFFDVINGLNLKGKCGIRELASILSASPSSVKRVMDKLEVMGMLENGQLMPNVIFHPPDRTDEVPRLIHRKAVKYLISFTSNEPRIRSIIVLGDVARGRPSNRIELLIVIDSQPPHLRDAKDAEVASNIAYATCEVSKAYPPISFDIALVNGFHWQSYLAIAKPFLSTRLYRAKEEGIVVYGEATQNFAELLTQWQMLSPMSDDDFSRMVERGYATQTEKGYAATMKWVEEYIAKAITEAVEDEIGVPVNTTKIVIPRIVLV